MSKKNVEFYYNNHRKIYDEKLFIRLSKKWESEDLKIQFREIAHSIRNEFYNPKNNLSRDLRKREIEGMKSIFNLTDTIRKEKKIILEER